MLLFCVEKFAHKVYGTIKNRNQKISPKKMPPNTISTLENSSRGKFHPKKTTLIENSTRENSTQGIF